MKSVSQLVSQSRSAQELGAKVNWLMMRSLNQSKLKTQKHLPFLDLLPYALLRPLLTTLLVLSLPMKN